MKTPTLIGISGRIKAGKDTTAHIIQLLDVNQKYFSVDAALDSIQIYQPFSKWGIHKFAGKLKEIGGILAGVPPASFEDQDFKNSSMGSEWDNMTYRQFLQLLGTDAIRKNLHPNAWVNATMADYKPGEHWLITDVRFPNEAQAIIDRGGVVIRVVRDESISNSLNLHESETALDDWKFDHIIRNYGTLSQLEQEVKMFCHKYNLL